MNDTDQDTTMDEELEVILARMPNLPTLTAPAPDVTIAIASREAKDQLDGDGLDAEVRDLLKELDSEPAGANRGEPIVGPDFLFYQGIDSAQEALPATLATEPRIELQRLYRHHVWAGRRAEAWVLAEHFTRRGVPPCFRPSPYRDGEARIPEQDILLHDIHWIATRYPTHVPRMKRYYGLFKPSGFVSASKFLLWTGLHRPGFYVFALDLSEDQQTECVYLRRAPVRARLAVIERLKTEAHDRIEAAHMRNDRAWSQGDPQRTVKRRHDIWYCGSMARWSPTRTAKLYEALTGESMTRSLAGKLIGEVHAAYPESKPMPLMRRRHRNPSPSQTQTARSRGRLRRNGGERGDEGKSEKGSQC